MQYPDDAPVLTCGAGTFDGLVDFDDAAFNLGNDAFVLFLKRAGQYNVGVLRGLIEKEINRDIEIKFI